MRTLRVRWKISRRGSQTVRSGHRTALLDAIYYGVTKMKEAKHERKALLVVSDGGDNRSRYTEGEVRAQVRESDVEIYSIGIFDPYAATPKSALDRSC